MRRFRLKDLPLRYNGRRFEAGAVLTADDAPLELLEARLAAGTADLDGGEASAELLDLLAAHLQAVRIIGGLFVQVIDLVERGGAADRAAFLEHLQAIALHADPAEARERMQALLEQAINDTQPSDPAPAGETESPAEAGDQSGGEAAGDPAPPETAGAATPAVDGNSPPQEGAVSGEPAAGQPAAGEPAHIAEQAPAQTGAAGDGGQPAPAPAPAAQPKAGVRKSGGGSSRKKA